MADERCPFLRGIEEIYLPVAHAEGKFVMRDATTRETLDRSGQLVLRYCPETGGNQDAVTLGPGLDIQGLATLNGGGGFDSLSTEYESPLQLWEALRASGGNYRQMEEAGFDGYHADVSAF